MSCVPRAGALVVGHFLCVLLLPSWAMAGTTGKLSGRVHDAGDKPINAATLRLLGEPGRVADVIFLEPILPGDAEGRRRLAETARGRIVEAMGERPQASQASQAKT